MLHTQAFRDGVLVRYGWTPPHLPQQCVCGMAFCLLHAQSCLTRGYPAMRPNELRNVTASLLDEVAYHVVVEPGLQPLSGERFAIREDGTLLEVVASGVWGGRFKRAYFDVPVFNPLASSNQAHSLSATYAKHEGEKRRQYEERVREIEHAVFVPLVFSATGLEGRERPLVHFTSASPQCFARSGIPEGAVFGHDGVHVCPMSAWLCADSLDHCVPQRSPRSPSHCSIDGLRIADGLRVLLAWLTLDILHGTFM
eukprot:scpid84964/ scgid26885/ 